MKDHSDHNMIYQRLDKSDLLISRIGFGCMSLKPGNETAASLIDKAIDSGINFFDTADLYDKGENEILVGKALSAKRQQVIIATKVGNEWRKDGSGWDWNPTKSYILQSVDESLRRLQTDYIDLYQLHGGTINDDIDDTIDAFETLHQQGKIRYYGISSIRPNVIREYVHRSNIVSVMMQYSLLDRRPEETCFDLLQQHNIGVLARGTVAGGLLAGKNAKPYLDHSANDVQLAADAIENMSGRENDPAAIAIQFALQQPAVTAAIVGIRTTDQLAAALKSIDLSALHTNSRQRLHDIVPVKTYREHR